MHGEFFLNKLELSDQKDQNNGILRDENNKEKFLSPIKGFVLSKTDFQLMYFMVNIFLKGNIY